MKRTLKMTGRFFFYMEDDDDNGSQMTLTKVNQDKKNQRESLKRRSGEFLVLT